MLLSLLRDSRLYESSFRTVKSGKTERKRAIAGSAQ